MAPLPLAHLVSPVVRGRGGVGEPARTTRHSPNRSTGQDAVAVIKNELKLLIPGIKIFLDVDDLKDIGSLEDYVDRTQVMLFFLSKGYFRSKALPQPLPFRECLAVSPTTTRALLACRTACARFGRRSRRASRSSSCKRRTRPRAAGRCRRSPPDPCSMTLRGLLSPHTALRGGVAAAAARQHSLTHTVAARLQELRAQCPEVLQPEIFDSGWAQTTWHRIDEYQRVSLKIISEVPPRTTPCSCSAVASTLTAAPSHLPSGAPPLLATLPEPDLPPALHPGRGPGPADLLLQVRRALGLAVR